MDFHDEVGLGGLRVPPPRPPVYVCETCGRQFPTIAAMRTHRFEKHPLKRPALFLRGLEVGNTSLRISRPLQVEEIEITNTLRAEVNGRLIKPEDLASELSSVVHGAMTVTLASDGQMANFSILFDIATQEDVAGVERSFQTVARRGRLDRRAIENFIESSRDYRTATTYCDGITNYLYGVLAKERSPESSLRFAEYREKFNSAADALKDFMAPLGLLIQGLVGFHFNQFVKAGALGSGYRVGAAGHQFAQWVHNHEAPPGDNCVSLNDHDSLLSDLDTERIIRWALDDKKLLVGSTAELESFLGADGAELDKAKVRILLAETYRSCGDREAAKRCARQLRNSPDFESWALAFLK